MLLSLGSNIEPLENLLAATRLLAGRLRIVATSQVFETAPAGVTKGPTFLNAALEIRCTLEPLELKYRVLRSLEEELGRVRSDDRNAPRTIDVDISLYGQRVLHDREVRLEIPDPEILTRAHVAIPLADVAPDFLHPGVRLPLAEIARRLDRSGVRVCKGLALWSESDKL